jgi:hypothetical protein
MSAEGCIDMRIITKRFLILLLALTSGWVGTAASASTGKLIRDTLARAQSSAPQNNTATSCVAAESYICGPGNPDYSEVPMSYYAYLLLSHQAS